MVVPNKFCPLFASFVRKRKRGGRVRRSDETVCPETTVVRHRFPIPSKTFVPNIRRDARCECAEDGVVDGLYG